VAAAKEVKARANHLAHAATASASMALVSATNQQLGLLNLEQQHVMASTANLPSHYCTVRSNKSTNSTHSGKVMAFGGKAEDGAAGAAEAGGGGSLDESNGPPPVWDIFSSVSRHEDDDNNVEKMRNDDARNKLVRRSSCGDISDFDGGGGGGVGGGGGDQNQPFPFDLSRHSHTIGGGSSSSSSSSSSQQYGRHFQTNSSSLLFGDLYASSRERQLPPPSSSSGGIDLAALSALKVGTSAGLGNSRDQPPAVWDVFAPLQNSKNSAGAPVSLANEEGGEGITPKGAMMPPQRK